VPARGPHRCLSASSLAAGTSDDAQGKFLLVVQALPVVHRWRTAYDVQSPVNGVNGQRAHALGLMFWLTRNKLSGSYFALIEPRRL
jgi:hypothetical protein